MRGKENKLIVTAFFSLLFSVQIFADVAPVTIKAAETLEKEKKHDQAMVIYEEWLKQNPSEPRFAEILIRCAELKKNPLSAIELYKASLETIKDERTKKAILKKIAVLYYSVADWKSALSCLEQVYREIIPEDGKDFWLVAVPFLSIAVGEIDRAYEWIKIINPVVKEPELRAELNYALVEIYLARDDYTNAEKAFAILKNNFLGRQAWIKTLFRFFTFYISQNNVQSATTYYEILKKDFPACLEFQAAKRILGVGGNAGNVIALSMPHEMLGTTMMNHEAIKSLSPDPNDQKDDTKTNTLAVVDEKKDLRIQVGSYTMLENAQYMVKDLERLRYSAEIVTVQLNGKTYYRVLIGNMLSDDQAQSMLAELRDHGIGGYLYTYR